MKKLLIFCLTCVMVTSLVGCANGRMSNQNAGVIAGGIAGGLVGSAFGSGSGRAAAIMGGALLGSFIGSQMGRALDRQARYEAMLATERALNSGRRTRWSSNRAHGLVDPDDVHRDRHGRRCRRFYAQVWVDGAPMRTAKGVACRQRGRWYVL